MARRPKRRRSKRPPMTVHELVMAGGPERLAREAADVAAREQRQFWLSVLEEHAKRDDLDDDDRMMCELYIRELRRKLGIAPPKDVIREQTRERVRRLRERRKASLTFDTAGRRRHIQPNGAHPDRAQKAREAATGVLTPSYASFPGRGHLRRQGRRRSSLRMIRR
jgi:hypothetical protein